MRMTKIIETAANNLKSGINTVHETVKSGASAVVNGTSDVVHKGTLFKFRV